MRKASNDFNKAPLIAAALGFVFLIAMFSLVGGKERRGEFNVERAIASMCQIKKNFRQGWLGSISSRGAVVPVWDAMLYQKMRAKFSGRNVELDDISVNYSGNVMVVDMGRFANSKIDLENVLQDYHDLIVSSGRSPGSDSDPTKCFYKLSYKVFSSIKVVSDSGEVERSVP